MFSMEDDQTCIQDSYRLSACNTPNADQQKNPVRPPEPHTEVAAGRLP